MEIRNESQHQTVSKQSSPLYSNPSQSKKVKTEILEIAHLTKIIESNQISSFSEKFQRVKSFEGHLSEISSVYLSKNSSFIISCSKDDKILIWKLKKADKKIEIKTGSGGISCLAVDPSETLFATGLLDSSIKVWDYKTKGIACTFEGHVNYAKCLSFRSDCKLLASCSTEYAIYLWDINTKLLSFKLEGHHGNINSHCFHPKKNILISCAEDRHIFLWNTTERKVDFDLKGNIKAINCIAISSTGSLLAGAGDSSLVRIFNIGLKAEQFSFKVKYEVLSLQFANKNDKLYTSGSDKSITAWCLTHKIEMFKLDGHNSSVSCLSICSSGLKLATGSYDKTVKLWDFDHRIEESILKVSGELAPTLSLQPEENYLSCVSDENKILIWDLSTEKEFLTLEYHIGHILEVCFSPNGLYLSSACSDKSLTVTEFKSSTIIVSFTDPKYSYTCTCFTASSEEVIGGLEDMSIRVYSIKEKTELFKFFSNSNPIHSISCSPNGKMLASVSNELILWDLTEKTQIHVFNRNKCLIKPALFSPDNFYIAGTLNSKKVVIFNIVHKRDEFSFFIEHESPTTLCYSYDGKFIPTGYQSGLIVIWNFLSKSEEYRIKSHSFIIKSLIVSKNSKNLYSACSDNLIRITYLGCCESSQLNSGQTEILDYVIAESDKEMKRLMSQNKVMPEMEEKESFSEYMMIKPEENYFLETKSIFSEQHADFYLFFNAIYQIQHETYNSIILPAWGVRISNLKYTPLHLAAFKGVTKALQQLIDYNTPIPLKSDALGRSPIYYSIQAKHQNTTEIILNLLILVSEKCLFTDWVSSFVSIKNDLTLIIKSSATSLPGFLAKCFYIKDELPVTGISHLKVKFLSTINSVYTDLVDTEVDGDKENLRIKTCLFEIPASRGTSASIMLIRSIIASTNKEIFNTQFIKYLILYKWCQSTRLIYGYGVVIWFNLVLLVLILSKTPSFMLFCGLFLNINLLLIGWEYFKMRNEFFEYVLEFSNWFTLIKSLLSVIWVGLLITDISFYQLTWVVVLFNVLRGIFGFRSFTTTRYYLQLIIQSIKSIQSFLLIFIYTTFSAGLLSLTISSANEFSIQTLWIDPFGLTVGDTDNLTSAEVNLKYITFCIAVFINIIVMLNMIISILGDSFDEFQLNALYYDFKERTFVVYEIEQIMGLFRPVEEVGYLHICVNSNEADENLWRGKLIDLRLNIRETGKKLSAKFKKVENKLAENEDKLTRIEAKTNLLSDQIRENNSSVDKRIKTIEESIKSINEGIQSIMTVLRVDKNSV